MPDTTICVPAYRAARFLGQTLSSLAAQTERDFLVDVAIEPVDADETLDACRPYRSDSRFKFRVNTSVLGWHANVRQLLSAVETPYFAILPHDDLWHPEYLATLRARLSDRSDASVVYSNMFLFGEQSGVREFKLPDAELGERLLAFFLGGAEGTPWRGISRSAFLSRSFPGNEFSGFAVEVEWALHLVTQGVALHVQSPLYLKRGRKDADSVSAGWRFHLPETELRRAIDHHRERLLAAVAAAPLTDLMRRYVEMAAEAAMLRRWAIFSAGRHDFDDQQRARFDTVVTECRADGGLVARRILARAYLAFSFHMTHRRETAPALEYARQAAQLAADDSETMMNLAQLLAREQRVFEALPVLYAAARLSPLGVGLRRVEEMSATRLEAMFPFEPEEAS